MRYFTPMQAEALLPTVRTVVEELLECRRRVLDRQEEMWPAVEAAAGNGGSAAAGPVLAELLRIRRGVAALRGLGVQLKDLNEGLVDFPSRRHGREVLLCWRHGETSVGHWHEVDAGFAGRQPIDPADFDAG